MNTVKWWGRDKSVPSSTKFLTRHTKVLLGLLKILQKANFKEQKKVKNKRTPPNPKYWINKNLAYILLLKSHDNYTAWATMASLSWTVLSTLYFGKNGTLEGK